MLLPSLLPRPRAPVPPDHQLPLPLDLLAERAPPSLPPSRLSLTTPHIWATLLPTTRQQVRQTVLHVLQDVVAHADQPEHDAEKKKSAAHADHTHDDAESPGS
jgi:hypothetical protein